MSSDSCKASGQGRQRGHPLGKLTRDLEAITAGLCDEKEEADCAAQFGDNLAWSCSKCEKRKAADLHPYTVKLLRIRHLQQAGYNLAPNDLTYEEWLDLGDVFAALSNRQESMLTAIMQSLIGSR